MSKYLTSKATLAAINNAKTTVTTLEALLCTERGKPMSNAAYVERALNAAKEAYKQALLMLDDLETPAGWDTAIFTGTNGEFDRIENGDATDVHLLYCKHLYNSLRNPQGSVNWHIVFKMEVIERGFDVTHYNRAMSKATS